MRNKNSNIEGMSPNVVKVIIHLIRYCFYTRILSFKEVTTLKRDTIEENQFLIQ